MVIDTSALVAIFLAESESEQFLASIVKAPAKLISAASLLETGIVLESRLGDAAGREFDLFVLRAGLEVISVDAEQIEIARSAWRKYGKGRHLAALNFGDCFPYALSKLSGEPLLAKGAAFAHTDVELCAF